MARAREAGPGTGGGDDTFENEEEDAASAFFDFPLPMPQDCHIFVSIPVSDAYGVTWSSLGVDIKEDDVSLLPDIDLVVGGAEPLSEPD
jgi:hypothetical protein